MGRVRSVLAMVTAITPCRTVMIIKFAEVYSVQAVRLIVFREKPGKVLHFSSVTSKAREA